MSWQVYAYALLALVLVGGFAWYERSRPPARMVALVAALAALAVAGRLVFAAIPNVVATTDIVLITGYAVGAAPGFAVGALAAPLSNPWLRPGAGGPRAVAGGGPLGFGGRGAGRRRLEPVARPGAVDAVADGGVGPRGLGRRGACRGHGASPRPRRAGSRLRPRRHRVWGAPGSVGDGYLRRRAVARPLSRHL